ncbi:Flagellar protein FliL OS=Castellaniella defragrans OX=75697 GN=HNR28_000406 PE=3 SV=1 [Castellaniella defragrans]
MLRRLLKLSVLLIVVSGAAIGGTIFFMGRNSTAGPQAVTRTPAAPSPAHAAAPAVPAPIFTELAPFTVTLYGETRNRILYTAIALRLGDAETRKQIQDYMPEVRDRVLKVLSAQKLPDIQTGQGRQALADALKAALSRPFVAQLPHPDVADVLFTAFVVQ